MHLSMSSRCGWRWGIGQGFDCLLWPGVGHLNYLAVPGEGIFEFLFVPLTTNHFLGWGISVIFDLTFFPGGRKFDSNFWENVKILPYAPPPPLPCRLDIDSYISLKLLAILMECMLC